MQIVSDKESPFYPGRPVPIEYFVARKKEINIIERTIRQALSGRNENIFISGDRGIGKSSLGGYARYFAEKNYNFIGTHCYLGGVKDINGIIRMIFQRLLQDITDKNIFDKLIEVFKRYIKSINLFGFGIEFTKDSSELQILVDNFIPTLRNIYETIKEHKKGLILILDDLNGVTNLPEFSQFLKSFIDEMATSNIPIPLLLILIGIPERREDMIKHQPSVSRIFNIIDLSPMNEDESKEFFIDTFGKKNINIKKDSLSFMIQLSGGYPMLMHEVGDAVFWVDNDNEIDEKDANEGIIYAAGNIGKKYLQSQVYQALKSRNYLSILRKLGKEPLDKNIRRKDVPKKDLKTFDNFIMRMKNLGIIVETESKGEYRFANQLYHLYIRLESFLS